MNRILCVLFAAGCIAEPPPPPIVQPRVWSTFALSSDDRGLWVVNPDSDSVSLIDPAARALVAELLLASAPPSVDAAGRFEPRVKPRALALTPDDAKLYVAGQTANAI